MAIEENIEHIENFDKIYDPSKPIAFRAGAEGSATKNRHTIVLDNQIIKVYDTKNNTKRDVTKEELLNGKMIDLLEALVTNVYWNMRFQESNLKNETYSGPANVTLLDVAADKIPALNTVFERCEDYKKGNKVRMIVSKKQARVNFDEPVKDNIGLLTFTQDGVKKGDMYIIDVVLEKDSSGGYRIR